MRYIGSLQCGHHHKIASEDRQSRKSQNAPQKPKINTVKQNPLVEETEADLKSKIVNIGGVVLCDLG